MKLAIPIISLCFCLQATAQQPLQLWYMQPAQKWTDALPLGNGRLGAMVFGGSEEEHIQFNEQTFWSGGPREYARKGAVQYLQPIRDLLEAGKQEDATDLAEAHFMGMKSNGDDYELSKAQWLKRIRADERLAQPAINDAAWKTMTLPTPQGWEDAGLQGLDGSLWFRSVLQLPQDWVGKDILVDLGKIRDLDFTYVNGKQVGTTADGNTARKYVVKASQLHAGANSIVVNVINFNDKGGFTGRKNNEPYLQFYPVEESQASARPLSREWKYFVQDDTPPLQPQYNADYLPFADVHIRFKHQDKAVNYQRQLDIGNAVAAVNYSSGGVAFRREYFISAPKQVMAMHYTAAVEKQISCEALFSAAHKQYSVKKINGNTLAIYLQPNDGELKAAAYLRAEASGGTVSITDSSIQISKAGSVTFYLAAATSFVSYNDVVAKPGRICLNTLGKLAGFDYHTLKQEHIKDYQQYFNRFSISLGQDNSGKLPTDQRIRQYNHQKDPALLALYMQYARYLLISSSRPGSQPANLQGIWNDRLTPPWGSKYTTNINLEMNYWPAEILNLSACAQPLFGMLNDLSLTGAVTAREHYGAPGWVLHHNTDIWRGTAPVNAANHGIWVTGSAWLSQHLWEHFLFTQDTLFLLKKAYPVMKSAAQFYHHFLVKDKATGWLISTPSNSPENGGLVAGPSMDHQIIRELYRNCISAAGLLKTDAGFKDMLQKQLPQIAPGQVGKYGQLQEWVADVDDTANHHRHVSHLWGVFPGTDITWKDSTLMRAAKQSLLYRGDDGTGWSLAWKVNLWARFRDGDHALLMMDKLLSPVDADAAGEGGGIYNNMFDAHPPFQIDGNFGGAAGLAEMLLQSHDNMVELLPALPAALKDGEVKGICARGGLVLNITWKNGVLQVAEITSAHGNDCLIKYSGKQKVLTLEKGKKYRIDAGLNEVK